MKIVEICPPDSQWANQFEAIAAQLHASCETSSNKRSNLARIDHIGSTAVPELAAKDVIDIQVSVFDLDNDEHVHAFTKLGLLQRLGITHDLLAGVDDDDLELRKQFFREVPGQRRAHIHVREVGRLNQRYALVFRDYLRADPTVRRAYELAKRRLAEIYPQDIDGYLSIKDPMMDIIYRGAEQWAQHNDWSPERKS